MNPSAIADADHLRFGSDDEPGIHRRGTTRFRYVVERTGRSPSRADLDRIRALAIPPAWTDVWIAADPDSHLQATGRDARHRKQYRYHPAFSERTSELKFGQLHQFGSSLGRLRRRVQRDLASTGLGHDKVVAVVVRLLDLTSLRVGNEHYAQENKSFGLTTLRSRHAAVRGDHVLLGFIGKSHHRFDIEVTSHSLARVMRRCQDLPGQLLFQYRSVNGALCAVRSNEVNAYLAEHCRPDATAKTFRTWNATVAAAQLLADAAADGPASARRLNAAIDVVASELGNTRAVCRQSYVHPAVVAGYLDGTLARRWRRAPGRSPSGLTVDELRTLRLLRSS
jgi:DNA topoisomerase-1